MGHSVTICIVLFAYKANAQHSTRGSPFLLLYGRDPVLPITSNIDADDNSREITLRMSTAWRTAQATSDQGSIEDAEMPT